jgi:cell division protein FtsI/penicillin-binding protein 2
VILDVRTGEVKAIAEPSRESDDEPLLSFEPILVGSVVKPIMAAAILSRQPALGMLRVPYAGDTVTSVAGVPLRRGFANDANGCGGEIGFTDFLRCSSNEYAAELVVHSLQQDGWTSHARGALVPRATLEHSTIATGLAEVFDVDAYANRTPGRLALYWSSDSARVSSASSLTADRSLIPYESRPWILFPDSAGTGVDLVARYAFGGWENRWTLLGLAQAYARIATGHNVQATFLHRAGPIPTSGVFAESGPLAGAAFARVRGALRQVPVNGTAAGLSERLHAVTKDPIVVLAKTGTLNENTAGGKLKSLAIAMGRSAGKGPEAALTCGLVAISYFEFADDHRAKIQRSALPRIHRDFAEGAFADVMGRHWSRVSGCDTPSTPVKPPLGQVASK